MGQRGAGTSVITHTHTLLLLLAPTRGQNGTSLPRLESCSTLIEACIHTIYHNQPSVACHTIVSGVSVYDWRAPALTGCAIGDPRLGLRRQRRRQRALARVQQRAQEQIDQMSEATRRDRGG